MTHQIPLTAIDIEMYMIERSRELRIAAELDATHDIAHDTQQALDAKWRAVAQCINERPTVAQYELWTRYFMGLIAFVSGPAVMALLLAVIV